MKYVAVRHKPEQEKLYWFLMPESISDKAIVGSEVICNTRRGKAKGVIEAIIEGASQDEANRIMRTNSRIKNIIAIAVDYELGKIHIPSRFRSTSPDPSKLSARIKEFYKTGGFDTPVVFSPKGVLMDGYTAYLVAKMFDCDSLHGFCLAI